MQDAGETARDAGDAMLQDANALPGAQTITMEPGIEITLTATLPTITETVTIIGSGNTVDGSALHGNADCLIIAASNVLISSLDFYRCVSHPISILNGGDNHIMNCTFRDNADSIACSSGTGNNTFGPNNELTGVIEIGIESYCPGDQIIHNTIYYPGNVGIAVSADSIAIFGDLCVGGVGGILLGNFATNCTVWHNTIIKTEYAAINAGPGATFEMWNNIFAFNSTWGVANSSEAITSNNNNLWSNNIGGDCNNCTLGAEAVTSDPLFVDRINDNHSLQSTSPAINAGAESSWNVNGSSAGLFNGSAPDIGYSETP